MGFKFFAHWHGACIYTAMEALTVNETTMRARILFVDDSRMMRVCAERILAQHFDLVLCDSAESAWEALINDPSIQMMFTDLQMPGKSGFDLLKDLRSSGSARLAEMPVVLITAAEDREEKRKEALSRGATDFITKPFSASELMARAKAHADSGQSRQRLHQLESSHHLDDSSGLGNRRYCETRLEQAISFSKRHGQSLTLMHLRLDGLARLLDNLGSDFAARAQRRIGDTLSRQIRREDTVFRTGREYFTFLLPATNAAGAEILQERFMPDLVELGLCAPGDVLDVRARFTIQSIRLDDVRDASAMLEAGLTGKVGGRGAAALEAVEGMAAPDLEEALRLAEAGQIDCIRPHLSHLRQRLQPLLSMMEERV